MTSLLPPQQIALCIECDLEDASGSSVPAGGLSFFEVSNLADQLGFKNPTLDEVWGMAQSLCDRFVDMIDWNEQPASHVKHLEKDGIIKAVVDIGEITQADLQEVGQALRDLCDLFLQEEPQFITQERMESFIDSVALQNRKSRPSTANDEVKKSARMKVSR